MRAELAVLEEQLTAGEIDEEEFDRREDELLVRLAQLEPARRQEEAP